MKDEGKGKFRTGAGVDAPAPVFVIDTPPASGAWNMACDHALLEGAAKGHRKAVLRFYRWQPPALSIGFFQDLERHVNKDAARGLGIDVVRRPTGGKALLHLGDLTYAVVVGPEHPLTKLSIAASYEAITRALAGALEGLGVEGVSLGKERSAGRAGAVCFAEHLVESLLVQGKKLLGSAQVRKGGALLQHGSLKLRLDPALEASLFRVRRGRKVADVASLIERTVTSLSACLGNIPPWERLKEAFVEALVPLLGEVGVSFSLRDDERARAADLAATVYGDPEKSR